MTRGDGAPSHAAEGANPDNPQDRLKGSVQGYQEPFEPVGLEDWEAEAHDNHAAISAAVLRTIPRIAREWGCSEEEMAALLGLGLATYSAWSSDPSRAALDGEQRERASLLLGIYSALETLFQSADRQCRWLHHPNQGALFQGRPPIEHLLHGGLSALRALRAYLDAELQGGFA